MEKVIVSPSELQPVPVQEESSSIAIKDKKDYYIKALLTPNSTGSGGYNKKKQKEKSTSFHICSKDSPVSLITPGTNTHTKYLSQRPLFLHNILHNLHDYSRVV